MGLVLNYKGEVLRHVTNQPCLGKPTLSSFILFPWKCPLRPCKYWNDMIEGNGFDTPEAGPSGWPMRGQNNELRRRYPEDQDTLSPKQRSTSVGLEVSKRQQLII